MEKQVRIKYLRISAKKLRMLITDYKQKRAVSLMKQLELQPNKGAQLVAKALKSAIVLFPDTAQDKAIVKNITADGGPAFKRWRAGSRGMAKKYSKRTAHLTIILTNGK